LGSQSRILVSSELSEIDGLESIADELPFSLYPQLDSVVAADHEGKKAAFIAGQEAGMRVLDGVRALVNFSKLSNAQVAFAGYSGGGPCHSLGSQFSRFLRS